MAGDTQSNSTVREYEVGYLVAPTVPEGEVESMAEDIAEDVVDQGAEMINSKTPEMRDLAYTMEVETSAGENEFDRAQFGWVQFSAPTTAIDEIENAFNSKGDLLRHLLVKIDTSHDESADNSDADTSEDGDEE